MSDQKSSINSQVTRRQFLYGSAGLSAAVMTSGTFAYPSGSDVLRVGVVGCGSRGTGAAKNCVQSSPNIKIVAIGDVFADKVENCLKQLKTNDTGEKTEWSASEPWSDADKVEATREDCFVGFDAYRQVIAHPHVDLVLLTSPPHFRPAHLKAAIEAGKHVFMEKPVAVDPVGVRSVIASSELAVQKGLAIVAGTQRRHQASYVELMKRIHQGEIGDLTAAQCYWNQGWVRQWGFFNPRQPAWSDMEWQLRNWYYFTWLSGDHVVEQHVHNIDVVNWAMGSPPVKAMGMGGREVRVEPEFGNIFDHFAVEYEYPNGARVLSMARQIQGCADIIGERIVGSRGVVQFEGSVARIIGEKAYSYEGPNPNPYEQEHANLIAGIRTGNPLNEGKTVAESTLTAIMGRMSAYTGRALTFRWVMNSSKLDLSPPSYELTEFGVPPIPVPGQTPLV
jgi:myo-inositol 2-dehydrogenase / D-chiro-inositol 1-dehydrogenase